MDFTRSSYEFRRCVERYHGHHKVKSFSCWDQFLTLAFAQLTFRESLRDIEACLRAAPQKLYHLGIRSTVSRNTLANQVRDWRIYADFAQTLIEQARTLYKGEPFGVELDHTVYALDATTIDLCLSLFPWAQFRRRKSAVKLHTLLDLRGSIPSVVIITGGQIHEVNILDQLIWEAGAIYLMDRGYGFPPTLPHASVGSLLCDASQKTLRLSASVFAGCRQTDRLAVRSDRRAQQSGSQAWLSRKAAPSAILRWGKPKTLCISHPQLSVAALTIPQLYQCRWQVELFFRWIKQHLRIKAFYGTSQNAVRTQAWTAIAVYVLVAIVKKRLNLERSLHSILQILSVSLFEKTPILQALSQPVSEEMNNDAHNQLILFN